MTVVSNIAINSWVVGDGRGRRQWLPARGWGVGTACGDNENNSGRLEEHCATAVAAIVREFVHYLSHKLN
jgi:hypothetical protein